MSATFTSPLLTGLLAFAAFASPAGGRPEQTAAVEKSVQLTVEIEAPEPPEPLPSSSQPAGRLILRSLSSGEPPLEAAVAPGKKAVTLRVSPRTTYQASLQSPGLWAPRRVFDSGPAGTARTRSLPAWRTGWVTGRLKVSGGAGASLPEALELRFQAPPASPERPVVPASRETCTVETSGTFRCRAPAASLDFTIEAQGFVPHYFWGHRIAPEKTIDLGDLRLAVGASVAGWVEVPEGKLPAAGITARLSPLGAPGAPSRSEARLRSSAREAPADSEGFFQLAGVPTGSYLLEVEHPSFAAARIFPIEVWQGRETLLQDPVLLRPPLELSLVLRPAVDWLGRPWQVRVFRASDFSASYHHAPALDGPAREDGTVRLPGQSPGRYWIRVADSSGNPLYSETDLPIETSADARREIELDVIAVEGTVSLGGEPIPADLWFGGRHGSVHVETNADDEGAFAGYLPQGGTWIVDVEAPPPWAFATSAKVVVEPDEHGFAEVSIDLPDNRVFGRVVYEDGTPAPKARLTLTGEVDTTQGIADEEGRFELRAVPEGTGDLAARLERREGRLTSTPARVAIHPDSELGPLTLRLMESKTITGRVRSIEGPVPGAVVTFLPQAPHPGYPATVQTDLEGRFAAEVPRATLSATVIVSPPGHALKTFSVPTDDVPLVLNVLADGGSLGGALPYSQDDLRTAGLTVRILHEGRGIPTSTLYRWAAGHGVPFASEGSWQVPNMAPGRYEICVGPRRVVDVDELLAWAMQEASCAAGYLETGGELTLDVEALEDSSETSVGGAD